MANTDMPDGIYSATPANGSRINPTTLAVSFVVAVTTLLIAVFIWPTPYAYERATMSSSGGGVSTSSTVIYRTTRLTGKTVIVWPEPREPK